MKKTFLAALAMSVLFSLAPFSSIPSQASEDTEIQGNVKIPKNGWYTKDGSTYYNVNGKNAKGLTKIGSKYYYFNTKTGQMRTGIVTIKGKRYFFSTKSGVRKKGWITYKGNRYYFSKKTAAALTGWRTISGKRYYFTKQGVMLKNRWLSRKYYFGADGVLCTGWQVISGKRYYFDPKTGKVTTGWATVEGSLYQFGDDGSMKILSGIQKSGSKYYYYSPETGELLKGWQTVGNYTYYFSTKNGAALTGWHKLDGKYYYFSSKGRLYKNRWIKSKYYVDDTGARVYGWLTLDGEKYYLNKTTGLKTTGWASIGSYRYYFDLNGVMQKDTWVDNCYLKSNGRMAKNTWIGEFYVDKNGNKTTQARTTGFFTEDSKTYYLDENYEYVKGWVEDNGKYYYFDPSTGVMAVSTWIEGFYVGKDGARLTDTMVTLDGQTYLFLSDGSKATSLTQYQENTYYFSMVTGAMETGLKVIGEDTYYFDPEQNGAMVINGERYIGNAYYKFGEDGRLLEQQDIGGDVTLGEAIAKFALKFVGNPYVYGGTSLTNGADCSGFTMSVFAHFNISLPHSAAMQATAQGGMTIPASALMPGDLVFYYKPIGHVAIYVGDIDNDGKGEVVHASNEKDGIKISDYDYTVITACARFW